MADRRRRRRRASQDSEEEEESGSGSESGRSFSPGGKSRARIPEPVESPAVRVGSKSDDESECESEDAVGEAVLSDYDSADLEENGSHSEGGEDEEEEGEHFSDEEAACPATEQKDAADAPAEEHAEDDGDEGEEEEEGVLKEVKAEKKGNIAGERQSGDGQESTDDPENKSSGKAGQKLDDDEDRKNPAYIPRKGLFFEHDVRGQTQDEERPKGRHRKLWKDEGRWEHDKFREEEQAPKSREELIAIYGYDIRNGTGPGEGRPYRSRRPRHIGSPNQEPKRYRDGEKPPRASWQGPTRSVPPATASTAATLQAGAPSGPRPQGRPSSQTSLRSFQAGRGPPLAPHRNEGRGHTRATADGPPPRGVRPQPPEGERAPRLRGRGPQGPRIERPGPTLPVEAARSEDEDEGEVPIVTTTYTAHQHRVEREATPSPRRQDPGPMADPTSGAGPTRESSPPPEKPVEKKSYSLARRTRARPSDLSKQASLEDSAPPLQPTPTPVKNESWQGDAGTQSSLSGLDQDLARLSLAGQNWAQSPPSYLRPEMRGIPSSMHMGGGPPQYANMEDMGVGGGRAKRYSSQRQRPVPEPAPMHIGVMEGHYYDPMSFQGPIYTHGDGPATMPPQGLLVQPEMHLPHPAHPGLHPHQSGGPMPNPALYAAPPVSMSPGQPPQQLLPPPFYPPPGVMTFSNTNYPYPAGATLPPMYPNPQAQSQVYGGVTYFDTVQQQAQPKPSPPRRTSQPVTVKPPPPEDQSRKSSEEVRS
ncbi:protein CASC3 isoform X1 [Electrophorus electricus]|uniref:protein CASC3 isoform X1 n=1 Tax=Electrophorus electricus TaxID=8005 RepID=UPI0015CFC656|nr:protein CASC3 isoform X1 [Electrophorus electricus]